MSSDEEEYFEEEDYVDDYDEAEEDESDQFDWGTFFVDKAAPKGVKADVLPQYQNELNTLFPQRPSTRSPESEEFECPICFVKYETPEILAAHASRCGLSELSGASFHTSVPAPEPQYGRVPGLPVFASQAPPQPSASKPAVAAEPIVPFVSLFKCHYCTPGSKGHESLGDFLDTCLSYHEAGSTSSERFENFAKKLEPNEAVNRWISQVRGHLFLRDVQIFGRNNKPATAGAGQAGPVLAPLPLESAPLARPAAVHNILYKIEDTFYSGWLPLWDTGRPLSQLREVITERLHARGMSHDDDIAFRTLRNQPVPCIMEPLLETASLSEEPLEPHADLVITLTLVPRPAAAPPGTEVYAPPASFPGPGSQAKRSRTGEESKPKSAGALGPSPNPSPNPSDPNSNPKPLAEPQPDFEDLTLEELEQLRVSDLAYEDELAAAVAESLKIHLPFATNPLPDLHPPSPVRRSEPDSIPLEPLSDPPTPDHRHNASPDRPKFYLSHRIQSTATSQEECCICLKHFKFDQYMARLECFHCFHQSCLEAWFQRKICCPTCDFVPTEHPPENLNEDESQ